MKHGQCARCVELAAEVAELKRHAQSPLDERRAFEKWVPDHLMPSEFSHGYLFKVDEDGDYVIDFVANFWDGWQARAALTSTPSAGAAQRALQDRADCPADSRRQTWERLVTPVDASALHYKIVDFIQEIDPFGGRFSAHELRIIGAAFADYGVGLVSRRMAEEGKAS